MNLLLGRWRNSAYSTFPSSTLCSCSTKGLLVTIPSDQKAEKGTIKHQEKTWKHNNRDPRATEAYQNHGEGSLSRRCSPGPKTFPNSALKPTSGTTLKRNHDKDTNKSKDGEVTCPPTTTTEGSASHRVGNPMPLSSASPWSPSAVHALWILFTSPIKLSIATQTLKPPRSREREIAREETWRKRLSNRIDRARAAARAAA